MAGSKYVCKVVVVVTAVVGQFLSHFPPQRALELADTQKNCKTIFKLVVTVQH